MTFWSSWSENCFSGYLFVSFGLVGWAWLLSMERKKMDGWTDARTIYPFSFFFCGGWYLFEGLELLRILPGGVNRLYLGIEIRECLRKCEVL